LQRGHALSPLAQALGPAVEPLHEVGRRGRALAGAHALYARGTVGRIGPDGELQGRP
jgi:hypothetical protein